LRDMITMLSWKSNVDAHRVFELRHDLSKLKIF